MYQYPNPAQTATSTPSTARLSSQVGYRGRCKYKSGRCPNERTLKYNGEEIHSLCEEHRVRHNRNQRKADTKRRKGGCAEDVGGMSPRTASSPMASALHVACRSSDSECAILEPSFALHDHSAFAHATASPVDDNYLAPLEDLDLYFQEDYPTWSNEDVAILMEFFVDSKC